MPRKPTYKRDCGACAIVFHARSGSQRFCDECKAKIRTKAQDVISIAESKLQTVTDPSQLGRLEILLEALKSGIAGTNLLSEKIKALCDNMKPLPSSNRAMGCSSKNLWRCGACGALCTSRRCLECELKIRSGGGKKCS